MSKEWAGKMTRTSCLSTKKSKFVCDSRQSILACWWCKVLFAVLNQQFTFLCNAKRSRLLCRKNCQPISCDNNPRVSELNNIFAARARWSLVTAGRCAGHRNFYLIYVWDGRWEIRVASLSIRRGRAAVALWDFAINIELLFSKVIISGKANISYFLKINKIG